MDLTPGKKGGSFDLPGGARLTVPEGQCMKKDSITVALVPPNKRSEYCPPLEFNDKLASNIYLLHAKPELRGPVRLQLSCVCKDTSNVTAMHRPPEGEWRPADDVNKSKDTFIFSTSLSGAFALIVKPLSEEFEVNPNGGLFNAHIDHLISVRVPKRSSTVTSNCRIQIIPINSDRIARARSLFPRETSDVDCLSPFYDFKFPSVEFKRPITVKLPLPEWCEEAGQDATASELVVMQRLDDQWLPVETALKFTKTTVAFDTKMLTRFCLVRPKKDRKVRVKLSMPRLESCNSVVRGDLLVFAMLEAKSWHLWAECVPQESVVEIISDRVKKGFTFLKKVVVERKEKEEEEPMNSRFGRRFSRRRQSMEEPKKQEDLEFINGSSFLLSLEGDLRFKPRPSGKDEPEHDIDENNVCVQFHELFDDNYRCVEVEPKPELREKVESLFLERVAVQRAAKKAEEEATSARGDAQNSHMQNGGGPGGPPTTPIELDETNGANSTENDLEKDAAKLVFSATIYCRPSPPLHSNNAATNGEMEPLPVFAQFPVSVDLDDMVDYFGLEPPPEPQPEPVFVPEPVLVEPEPEVAAPVVEEKKVRTRPANDAFNRLTTSNKRPVKISKESKVLTGRSLQVISRSIQQGLTLAVHLNLPDSVITGIGFDSLSNLHCLTDVTYKVLLHWKRTYSSRDRDRMVPDLCAALKEMGLIDMAAVVADRHRNNTELTPGCFEY